MSDESDTLKLIRRKLLGGLAVTGTAAVGTGAGTFALFRDSASSSGNTVSAGTLSVSIHDSGSLQWSIYGAPGGTAAQGSQDIIVEHHGNVAADHLEIDVTNVAAEDNDGDPRNGLTPGPESDPKTTADGGNSAGTDESGNLVETLGSSDAGAAGMERYVRVDSLYFAREDSAGSDSYTRHKTYLVDGGSVTTESTATENGHDHELTNDTGGYFSLHDLAASANEAALQNFTPPGSKDVKLAAELSIASDMPDEYQGDVLFTTVTFTLTQQS